MLPTNQRKLHTINAKGRELGRLASEVSCLLQGKNRTNYAN